MAEGCCKERGDGARKGGGGKEEDQKQETLIGMKEKGGTVLYPNMNADKGLIKQHTYSHATDFSLFTNMQDNA